MTCRERLKMEHPECVVNECDPPNDASYLDYVGGCLGCPADYGYLESPEWCSLFDCERCWGREIPDDFSESELKYLQSLEESLVEGFQSSVNHSEKSGENILAMCFSELIDAVSQGKVTVHYDVKSGIFKIIPAKIVRRDEELDKR